MELELLEAEERASVVVAQAPQRCLQPASPHPRLLLPLLLLLPLPLRLP